MSDTADQTAEAEPLDQGPDQQQVEVERRARNMGWRPRDEFRGDAERWIPAEEFVERGERMLPLLQERNRAADRQITELRDQVRHQGETLNTMLASARRAEAVGYRRAMQDLAEKRQRAVEMGDTAAFAAVEQAMRELGPAPEPPQQQMPTQHQQTTQQQQPNTDPTIQAWVGRNAWFRNDPVANVAMIAAMQKAEREMPSATVAEHLMEAEAEIRRRFPEHFGSRQGNGRGRTPVPQPQQQERRPLYMAEDDGEDEEEEVQAPQSRRQAAAVSRSAESPPPRRPGPRSFEAMPADVRQQFERQRKMLEGKGEPLTKEEFSRYYWEAEGQ